MIFERLEVDSIDSSLLMYTANLLSTGHAFIADGQREESSSRWILLHLSTLQRSPCKLGNSALIFSINVFSGMESGTIIFFTDDPTVEEKRKQQML